MQISGGHGKRYASEKKSNHKKNNRKSDTYTQYIDGMKFLCSLKQANLKNLSEYTCQAAGTHPSMHKSFFAPFLCSFFQYCNRDGGRGEGDRCRFMNTETA